MARSTDVMPRELWLFATPAVFFAAFVGGYRTGAEHRPVRTSTCAVLVAIAGAAGLLVPSLAIRVWSGVNAALALFCVLGILDNLTKHNPYSGYGAMVLAPLAFVTTASLAGCAAYATYLAW